MAWLPDAGRTSLLAVGLLLALFAQGCLLSFDRAQVCEGCLNDAGECLAGTEPIACGANAAMCVACATPTEACHEGTCVVDHAVVELGLNSNHSCILDRQGLVYCWGDNMWGQLGTGGTDTSNSPLRVIGDTRFAHLAVGGGYTGGNLAISTDGQLFAWGSDSEGKLGRGLPPLPAPHSPTPVPTPTGAEGTWTHVSFAVTHSCGVFEGDLWCWGWKNLYFGVEVDWPANVDERPMWRVFEGRDIAQISVQDGNGAVLTENGELYIFGNEPDGTDEPRLNGSTSPRPRGVGTGYEAVGMGAYYVCTLSSGELSCWGNNDTGQLGVSPEAMSFAPIDSPVVIDVPEVDSWAAVSGGIGDFEAEPYRYHTCAISNDGALYCWGDNTHAQLGLGISSTWEPPTRVGERNDWKLVTAGARNTCAARRDGTLFCWGKSSVTTPMQVLVED
jgi:alpha-tubulin suppressor-like RCC1 family protein